MSRAALLLTASLLAAAASARAQEAERLPTVTVDDEAKPARAYRLGDPLDSGTSRFDAEAVEANTPGSGDVNQLLKALPSAQFSINERAADREALQDLRPEQISISGGRPYENLFTVDGAAVNAQFDTTGDNPFDLAEVAGASPQTVWLDSNLVGGLTVRDSNISAEYGGFTGGVVEVVTRDPSRAFGAQASYGWTGSDLTSFVISDRSQAALAGTAPPEPQYDKARWGISADLPLNERLRLLAGYNRSESEVVYQRSANYGGASFGQTSVSENYLLKAVADLPKSVTLRGQVAYSPYESEAANASGINNQIVSHGGGLTSSLELTGARGEADWSLEATHAGSNTDRDSPDTNFSRPSAAPSVDWCAAANCTEGGFGSIRQRQDAYAVKGSWAQPLFGGDARLGFELSRVEVQKRRLTTNRAYQTGSVSPGTVCASPTDPACVAGEYALTRYQEYRAYDARAALDSLSVWAEHSFSLKGFDVRLGGRYDYESFLGDHVVSPRLSAARELPLGMTATLGLNRYYGRSFLSYAIREQYPDSYTYQRTAQVSGASRIWSENWTLASTSRGTRYSNAGLDTPYTDELTVALAGRLFGGEWRARGVLRQGRDEFARSASERLTYNPETGGTSTYTSYELTNAGRTDYRGGSLEYLRDFGRHSLSLSANASKTETNADTYFETSEDDLYAAELVVYNGQVVSLLDLLDDNQRLDFASPFIANAGVNSTWWGGRLRTGVSARFRNGFEQIAATGTTAVVGGVRYDVYDLVEYDASVTFNANASLDLVRSKAGAATLDVRVDNLFDAVPNANAVSVSQPYQLGRVVWLGLKYRY